MLALPKYLFDSLPLETNWIEELIRQDKKIMESFAIASYAIKNGKYKYDKRRQRLKLKATKDEFTELYLVKFLKKKSIIVSIIVDSIKEYWKNQPSDARTHDGEASDYDKLIAELDLILDTPIDSPPSCNCRNIGFSFCFCRKPNGDYVY